MKSIIRLLLISLSIACSENLSAESGLSLQKAQEIKSYIAAAQAIGFSNEEVKAAFLTALANADANGVVTLPLNNEHKKAAVVIGGITATALLVGLGVYAYNEGWFSKAVQQNQQNQPNQPNGQPDANAPVDQNAQQKDQPDALADEAHRELQKRMQAEAGLFLVS